jgi:hypothetical protein
MNVITVGTWVKAASRTTAGSNKSQAVIGLRVRFTGYLPAMI